MMMMMMMLPTDELIIIADATGEAWRRLMCLCHAHIHIALRRRPRVLMLRFRPVRFPVRRDRSYHVTGSHVPESASGMTTTLHFTCCEPRRRSRQARRLIRWNAYAPSTRQYDARTGSVVLPHFRIDDGCYSARTRTIYIQLHDLTRCRHCKLTKLHQSKISC